ncbi:MAG TPA: hypothetical protein PLE35_07625 [Lentisphaeria bacterium]|nr:hypothetical protein [Lentisphaeria bacterium]
MSATDLTKQINHIYWLWAAVVTLGSLTLAGYLALRDRDETLTEKISASEMTIKIQLAEIKTSLASVETTLLELKKDLKKEK